MTHQKLRAFFASPFASELRWIRDAVASACRSHDVDLRAVDELVVPGSSIVSTIHAEIEGADFGIAVLTAGNPNVFYELGRLLQASKPTIMLAARNDLHALPFDVRTFAVLAYSVDPGSADQLERSVGDAIGRIRLALNPKTRSSEAAFQIVSRHQTAIPHVRRVDFEEIRREAESMIGKSNCETVDITSYDTDTFKGWNQTLDCPCGDTIVIVVDLNGEIRRVRKK